MYISNKPQLNIFMYRYRTQLILFFLFCLPFSSAVFCQFEDLTQKISAFNQKFPEEIVYIHIDREVYNPGDTLWFKAYLRHKVTLQENTLSKSLFIKLLSNNGRVVHQSIYPVFDSETIGQFKIEEGMKSGTYQLICYSSFMKNGEFSELYRKSIRIQEETTGRESFNYSFDQGHYSEGDTMEVSMSFLDAYKSELPDIKIKYKTLNEEGFYEKGSMNASTPGNLSLIVTQSLIKAPELELSATYKGDYFDTIVSLPILSNIEVEFYPEGGTMIEGMSNQIAFKADSESGIPFEIKGGLFTEQGEKIGEVNSDFMGMGSFLLIPEPGEKYHVQVTEPPNVDELFYLPEPNREGWVLQASYRNQNLLVTLNNTFPQATPALITVSIRDFLVRYTVREVDSFDSFSIPTGDLPAGIAVITLFDDQLLPRAERLVFINHEKRDLVQLESNRSSYLPRDSVRLKIRVSDHQNRPVKGSYSLTVVDEELCLTPAIDEPDAVSSLLLSSEIKGYIQTPGHYLNAKEPRGLYHLDLLLLTQGWRRYRYDYILENEIESLPPPRVYDVVSGQLFRYRYGRDGIPTKGIIQVFNSGGTAEFETDADGRFRYLHNYHPTLNPNVVLLGLGENENQRMEIHLDADEFEDQLIPFFISKADTLFYEPFYLPEPEVDFEDQYTLGINNKWIEEVNVYAKRRIDIEYLEQTFVNSSKVSKDMVLSAPDVYGALLNMGLPVREERDPQGFSMMVYDAYPRGPIHWFVDDFNRDYDFVKNLWTGDIKALFVVKFPDTQMFEIPDRDLDSDLSSVIVSIHTIPYLERAGPPRRSNSVILPKLSMSKEFYRPRYDTEAQRYSQVPDLRKTIHWEPRVVLDENGEASITYYNGDRYTRVSCILEGISKEGIPVYGKTGYNVYTVRE